ncbi:hypothetical protein FNN61_10385 [Salmonella enterica subsp. diarizonae]|nr:hypothetical protein [Salmonella enterica subsp. diarizonae]ECJ2330634.1 hypothetical protein [Salmonella enterica subsp. diarizonae]ECJ2468950.1 hypothetical protein [Salmonella enterica subsp. diarizonae]
MKNHTTQSQIVFLPYVCAVDPTESAFAQAMHYAEQLLLSRVKAALDEAGVAWIDPRTKERSKPADASYSIQLSPQAEVENATSTAVKKHLHTDGGLGYVYPAPYKTGAGRCNPKLLLATSDAVSVFFVVCHMRHSMAWCATLPQRIQHLLSVIRVYHATHNGAMCLPYAGFISISPSTYNSTSRRPVMVTLAGQPQGWPVPSNAGIATPVNVTAPIERCNSSGDSVNLLLEAA